MGISIILGLILLAAAALISTPFMKWFCAKAEGFAYGYKTLAKIWDVVYYALVPVVLLLLSTACLVGDSYNPFIYFRF